MPKSKSYIRDVNVSKTTIYFNKSLSSKVPPHSSHFAHCIHEFCRVVLVIDNTQPTWTTWYQAPSTEQIEQVKTLPLSIASQQIDSLTIISEALGHSQQIQNSSIPIDYQLLFKSDILSSNFPKPCFSWGQEWQSRWNQIIAAFILKHWNNAYQANAFVNFPFNPNENTYENQHCVLH